MLLLKNHHAIYKVPLPDSKTGMWSATSRRNIIGTVVLKETNSESYVELLILIRGTNRIRKKRRRIYFLCKR
jgi:hypothetical protein